MRLLHLAAAAAAAVGASAQVPNDFRATYFSTADCSAGGSSSSVLAQQQYCQQVGGASASYEVWCSDDGANGTLVSWDADGACAGAAAAFRPFTSGQCLDSAGGSASVRYECLREPSTAPPALACGRCLVSWFEDEGCGGADRSVVDVPAGACQQDQQRSWLAGLEGGTQGSASRISFFRDSFCGAVDSSNMLAPAACAANPGMAASSFSVSCADACAPIVGGEDGGENEPAMTPNDFVATYFASPACDVSVGQQHSVVLAQQQFCQLGDGGRSSYQVWCADDGLNGTLVSFADGSCSGAFATTPFLSSQCLAAGNGASAVSFQCRVDAMTAPPALSCGRCQVSWFEVAGCTGNDRAIVDATAGLCQQDGSRSWMIGRDPNSGFAQVAFFNDAFCAINDVTTTLSTDDCAATPEAAESISGLGSRSMSASCATDCFPLPLPPVVAAPQASRAPHAVYTPAAAPSLAAQAPTVAYASASRMAAPPAAPSLAAQAPTQAYASASRMAAPPAAPSLAAQAPTQAYASASRMASPPTAPSLAAQAPTVAYASASRMASPPAAPSLAAQAPTVAYASASPMAAPPAAAPTLAAAQPHLYAASHSPTVVVAAPPPSSYHAAAPSASPVVVAAPPAHVYSTPAAAPSLAAQAPHAYAPSASPAAVVAAPPRPSAYHTAAPPVGAPASPSSAPPTMRPAPGGYNMPPSVGAPAPYRQPYNAMPPPPPVQAAPAPSTYAPFAYRRPYYAPQVILFDNDDDNRGFHRGRDHGGFGSWRRRSHSHRHHGRHHHH